MACSKYRSTKEKTNAARVSRLLVDPCTDLFRDLLRNKITEVQFPFILQHERSKLSPVLSKVQRQLLYPNAGYFNGAYTELDLSLLYILLRNISGISPHRKGWGFTPDPSDRCLSANIDRIRETRNKYCGHAPSVSLPDPEFSALWQDLTIIIWELEGSLRGGCTTYTVAANQIKIDTMDPEQEKRYLDIIDAQHQSIEDLKDTVIDVKKKQERQGAQQENFMSELQQQDEKLTSGLQQQDEKLTSGLQQQDEKLTSGLQQQDEKLTSGLQQQDEKLTSGLQQQDEKLTSGLQQQEIQLQRQNKELKSDLENAVKRTEKVLDSERINILDNTSAVLRSQKSSKVYARTSAVQATIDKLLDSHIVILTGRGGTGKTTLAYQVMCEMSDVSSESPYTPVLISSPEQWEKVINPNNQYIAYLDDFIGVTNLDTLAVEKWKNKLDVILSCAKEGNVMVMIGLRRNILDEGKKLSMHKILDEGVVIDLSSEHSLTYLDKAKMLKAYEENSNALNVACRLSDDDKHSIILTKPYFGFPLTCFQFYSRHEFFQLGLPFFKRPSETLFASIEKMRKTKSQDCEKLAYCVLCYVLMHGNIDTKMDEELFKNISEKVNISNKSEIDIKDAIDNLQGLYLSETTNQVFKFSHETIAEAVLVSFGQLAPDIVIKRCSVEQLYELIRTQKYESRPGEVVLKIPQRHYEDLAQRFWHVLEQKLFAFFISPFLHHPACFDSEFVSILLNQETSDKLSIFCQNWCWLLRNHYDTDKVLLKEILEHFGPHHSVLKQSQSEHSPKRLRLSESSEAQLSTPQAQLPSYSVEQTHEPNPFITHGELHSGLKEGLSCFRYRSAAICLIQYISRYNNLHHLISNGTVLHHCVLHGWEDAVDTILTIHKPTKTDRGWSCAHLAAFAGRPSLLQKFINLGQNITEKTEDGYSVLQAALLGLRYGRREVSVCHIPWKVYPYYYSLYTNVLFPGEENFKYVISKCSLM